MRGRVAIWCFGMMQNSNNTFSNFDEHVFQPLRKEYDVEVFVHTLTTPTGTNRRLDQIETSVKSANELKRIPFSGILEVESQALVDRRFDFESWYELSKNKMYSMNMYRSTYSLWCVSYLMALYETRIGVKFDVVIAVPLNTRFLHTLQIPTVLQTITVPKFDHWSFMESSFAIGPRDLMKDAYATQFKSIQKTRGATIDPERFLCDHLMTRGVYNVSMFSALKTTCLLYTSPSPRDKRQSRMPSSA